MLKIREVDRKCALISLLLWSTTLSVGLASSVMAQQLGSDRGEASGYTGLILALSDSFTYRNTHAVLVRRTRLEPHDVIVIAKSQATPALLASAVNTAIAIRGAEGVSPKIDALYRLGDRKPGDRIREAQRWVRILNDKKPRELPGFGSLRFIEILVPDSLATLSHRVHSRIE